MSRGACPPLPSHNSRFWRIHGGKCLHPSFKTRVNTLIGTTVQSWLDLSLNNTIMLSCHLSFAFYSCHKSAYQVDTKCNRIMCIIPSPWDVSTFPQWKSSSRLSYSSFPLWVSSHSCIYITTRCIIITLLSLVSTCQFYSIGNNHKFTTSFIK